MLPAPNVNAAFVVGGGFELLKGPFVWEAFAAPKILPELKDGVLLAAPKVPVCEGPKAFGVGFANTEFVEMFPNPAPNAGVVFELLAFMNDGVPLLLIKDVPNAGVESVFGGAAEGPNAGGAGANVFGISCLGMPKFVLRFDRKLDMVAAPKELELLPNPDAGSDVLVGVTKFVVFVENALLLSEPKMFVFDPPNVNAGLFMPKAAADVVVVVFVPATISFCSETK